MHVLTVPILTSYCMYKVHVTISKAFSHLITYKTKNKIKYKNRKI